MSTQINVTVGSGGLSDKAKQLQAAARQAQLEKERTIDLSAEALDKRIAAQAAKGLSVDGQPLYGVPTALPIIERRPAANRNGLLGALLTGPFVYTDYGGSYDGLLVRCRNAQNVYASRFNVETSAAVAQGVSVPGPIVNTTALEPAAVTQPEPELLPVRLRDSFDIFYAVEPAQSTALPNVLAVYAVLPTQYDALPNWQFNLFEIIQPPYQYLSVEQQLLDIAPKTPLNKIKTFTQEFIMRVPEAYNEPVGTSAWVLSGQVQPVRSSSVTLQFAGISLSLRSSEVWDITGLTESVFVLDSQNPDPNNPISNADATPVVKSADSQVTLDFRGFGYGDEVNPNPINAYSVSVVIQDTTPLQWLHVALVRRAVGAEYRWDVFVGGQKILDSISEPSTWQQTYGTQPPSARISVGAIRSANAFSDLKLAALQAARFTSKALYTTTFTPPAAITSLA